MHGDGHVGLAVQKCLSFPSPLGISSGRGYQFPPLHNFADPFLVSLTEAPPANWLSAQARLPNTGRLGWFERRQRAGQWRRQHRLAGVRRVALLRPGHDHINFAAAAFGADQPLAPIEHGSFGDSRIAELCRKAEWLFPC
jgi:hypothetical protein